MASDAAGVAARRRGARRRPVWRASSRWLAWSARRDPAGGSLLLLHAACWPACAGWYTSRPQFCNSCHIMEPYYKSWQESSHKDVSCIECHFPPGFGGKVRGKMLGLVQLAKYVTNSAGPAARRRNPRRQLPPLRLPRDAAADRPGRFPRHRPSTIRRTWRKPAAASSSAARAATARSSRAST